MGLFRRRKTLEGNETTADTEASPTVAADDEMNEEVQEVMKDNLELMKEVVMKIREDPDFAKNIYRDCPRLQHLLDQYPDLRPIFEDPKLVRINFEQVYRDAGGVLPEDEEKNKKSWLVWFVNSPCFKVLKVLLFVKKLVACIAGGGFAFLTGCFMGCCFEDALDELDGDADDADADDADIETNANKEALNRAADHMEDPEVQEQMQQLLDNPDNLEEAIENDHELSALRDSNPLCEELMSDPDTCRILTDPDNLRALGDAPELIELDFANPDGFTPDLETGGMEGYDGFDGGTGEMMEVDTGLDAQFEIDIDGGDDGFDGGDADADADGDGGDGDGGEEEEDDGGDWWEDAELEEQDSPDADDKGNTNNSKAQQKGAKGQAKQAAEEAVDGEEGDGKMGGIMASIGVCAADLIAGQIVGSIFGGDILPGGDIDAGGLDDVDGVVDDDVADAVDDTGDAADVAEDTMDEADEKKGEGDDASVDSQGNRKDGNTGAVAGGAAGGAAAGGAAGATVGSGKRGTDGEAEEAEEEEEEDTFEDEPPKKSRFGFLGTVASAVATATKEHIIGSILGDDFAEDLVERWEEGGEEDDEKKKGEDDDEEEGEGEEEEKEKEKEGEEEEKPKKRGLFRRK